jgi:hypothetical protein
MTLPKTVCFPSRKSAGAVVMKNWMLVRVLINCIPCGEYKPGIRWCLDQSWPVGDQTGRAEHLATLRTIESNPGTS